MNRFLFAVEDATNMDTYSEIVPKIKDQGGRNIKTFRMRRGSLKFKTKNQEERKTKTTRMQRDSLKYKTRNEKRGRPQDQN